MHEDREELSHSLREDDTELDFDLSLLIWRRD